ncbi:unnamed protein product [Mytilus coruscus]|uniref:Uncharacterized protein n=1 Tax=Mytilus coruscus TaxID=42192 RepID=A0A6J8ERS7_MYTCO|nr:unnamed protein product [Mytilus coruscus]
MFIFTEPDNGFCNDNPCKNGGKCIADDHSHYCECLSPYFGDNCEKKDINDLCDNHPCENGGSCYQYDASYYCHCISPFVGEHCDMELGLNDEGRLLIHQPTGTYSVCLLDWDDNDASVACRFLNKSGKGVAYTLPHSKDFKRLSYLLNCEGHEDSIDLCQGKSGDHIDISCEDQGDAALKCIEEDINNLCDNHPCENGGSCYQYDASYYCHCISPFVGEHCDMELGLNDEGRLLIHQPTGTYSVCLLDWDDNDASVACRFLNKPGKGVAYTLPHSKDFKRLSYLLNCEGHEDSIDLCQGKSGDHIDINCEDQGDAALKCIEEDINNLCDNHPCENGGSCYQYDASYYCHCISPFVGEHCDMELGLNDEGRLLIHQPTGTYSVCLLDWDDNDASVACRFLNKPGKGVAYTLPHSKDFKRLSYLLNCEGHEDSIDLCQGKSGDHIDINCEDQGDAALKCIEGMYIPTTSIDAISFTYRDNFVQTNI